MIDQEQQELVTLVIRGLVDNKYPLVEHLFGDTDETYKEKWLDMNGLHFWCNLDLDNRRKAIDFFLGDTSEERNKDA